MTDPRLKPEIFKQKVPCRTCPFRKEGGVRHPPEMLASYISYFIDMPGSTFPCHESVVESDDRSTWSEWQDGQVLCSGGLIFAAKQAQANAVMLYGISQGWYDPAQHSEAEQALVFDSPAEMLGLVVCPACDGAGVVAHDRVLDGRPYEAPCDDCGGSGFHGAVKIG